MKKTGLVIFYVLSFIFVSAVVFLLIIQQHKRDDRAEELKAYKQECNDKQNAAFFITDKYDIFKSSHSDILYCSKTDKSFTEPRLFIWLLYYYNETGNKLTINDINRYLYKQKRNVIVHCYTDVNEIKDYVDFMYDINTGKIKPQVDFTMYNIKIHEEMKKLVNSNEKNSFSDEELYEVARKASDNVYKIINK